jgi:cold shock CspA family protein
MRGTVSEFDDPKGYGTITADAVTGAGASFFFHCTQILDGSRTISPGESVLFDVRPWHRGQREATAIVKLEPR